MVIVPVGALHYVPFHALYDGASYLIETREVVYSPSATVWQVLNEKPSKKLKSALLIGFADEKIPLVNEEIKSFAKDFQDGKKFYGQKGDIFDLHGNAPEFRHSASCLSRTISFGKSAVFESSAWRTDLLPSEIFARRSLKAEIVTLSACETGLNKIFAGDEILGLARGFLSAGASSLVLSLWTVNDEATSRINERFL